jgi:ribosomal protein L7/L12
LPGAHERSRQADELPPAQPAEVADGLQTDVLSLLRAGRKIDAIKVYREHTNCGLAEAKQAVEALAAAHGITTPASGCAGVLLALGFVTWLLARALT